MKLTGYELYQHFCSCERCKQRGGVKGSAYCPKHDPPITSSTKICHTAINNEYFKIIQVPKYIKNMPISTLSSIELNWISLYSSMKTTNQALIPINNNEIITHLRKYGTSGFWRYSMDHNQCDLIVSDSYIGSTYFSMYCYNKNENAIYVFGSKYMITIYLNNIDDIKMEKTKISFNIQQAIITQINDNTYHMIGDDNQHLIWNINSKQSVQSYTNHHFHCIHGSVYLKSKHNLLVFADNSIWEYCLQSKQWNKYHHTLVLPPNISQLGYIVSNDDRYIVIFGVRDDKDDGILIYDLDERKMSKSKIQCPISGKFHALLISNCIDNKLLVFGYLKKHQISLPMDMINLITMFYATPYSSDYIHLFQYDAHYHWKMCLDFILRVD